ncbi:MAG TPA: hypothetical protein QGF63_19000 [Alphaproteobacteria bacterium]|nr:hypothetical protein [Alphaproteobacteria bacterium]MDP6272321.1 hypothetical protein [Alphaproteobacteria bacterium]MDP7429775.1 hypothetical protein [Alphaproteobacteria bacterium]HJM51913.1 hypothetical protein [Alphaproteobacteria bacterium]
MKELAQRLLFTAAFLAAASWLVWQSPLRTSVALEGRLESFTAHQGESHNRGYAVHHADVRFRLVEYPGESFVYEKEDILGWLPFTAAEARETLERGDELRLRLRRPRGEVMDIYRGGQQILGPFPSWLVWGVLMAVGGGLLGLIGLIMLTAPLIDRLSLRQRQRQDKRQALKRFSAQRPE